MRTQSNSNLYLLVPEVPNTSSVAQKKVLIPSSSYGSEGLNTSRAIIISDQEMGSYVDAGSYVSLNKDSYPTIFRGSGDFLFKLGTPVYLYDASTCKKRRVYTDKIMFSWGYSWSNVQSSAPSYAQNASDGDPLYYRDGTLVRAQNNSAVYVVEAGYKRAFQTYDVFSALDYLDANIVWLPDTDINNNLGFKGTATMLTASNIWQENYSVKIAGSGGDDGSSGSSGSGSGSSGSSYSGNFPPTVQPGLVNSFPATFSAVDFTPAWPLEGSETGIKLGFTNPATTGTRIFWVGSSGWWKIDLRLKALRFINDGVNPQWPEIKLTLTHHTQGRLTIGPFAVMNLSWATYTAYVNVVQTGEYILELGLSQETIDKVNHLVYFDQAIIQPVSAPGSPAVPPANPSLVEAPPPQPITGTTMRFYVSAAGDGYAGNSWGTWSTIRNTTVGNGAPYTQTIADGFGAARYDAGNGGWSINRGLFGFNTSALPDNATITDARLGICFERRNGASNDSWNIVSGSQASLASLSAGDYSKVGSTSFASIQVSSATFTGYTVFTLNASGIANINKTGDTKFATRLGCDLNNSQPTTPFECGLRAYMFEYGSQMPYLEVTYTVALGKEIAEPAISLSPTSFALHQNYPNPFNPETVISYDVPEQLHVELVIYGISGREVGRLVDEVQAAGSYFVRWRPDQLPSGTYLCRLVAGQQTKINKMMFIK